MIGRNRLAWLIATIMLLGATGASAQSAVQRPGGTVLEQRVNAQTGTSYTLLNGDRSKLVTFSNGSAVSVTLPQAGASSAFVAGWYVDIQNRGAGTVTITPTTSTIDGAATLALTTNQGARIASDGTNYYTQRGGAGVVVAGDLTGFTLIVPEGELAASGCTVTSGDVTCTIARLNENNAGSITGNVAINHAQGATYKATLVGPVNFNSCTNAVTNTVYTWELTQDATGGRPVTGWCTGFRWLGLNATPQINLGANEVTVVRAHYIGTSYDAELGGSNGIVSQGFYLQRAIAPTISGDQNNWAPTGVTTAATINVNGGAADRNITGLRCSVAADCSAADAGRIMVIRNGGATNAITLKAESASSTAANRFALSSDIALGVSQTAVVQYNGTLLRWQEVSRPGGASSAPGFVEPGLRLYGSTNTPVAPTPVTSTALFYGPYKSGTLIYYTGAAWAMATISEITLALTATVNKIYDVFVACSNATTCALSLSAAWTNDTTPADAVCPRDGCAGQDGVNVLGSDHTKLHVGTIRACATNTVCDTAGGATSQNGGQRFIWNVYNRVPRPMQVWDTLDSWDYGGDWRVANGASHASSKLNSVEFVVGQPGVRLHVAARGLIFANNLTCFVAPSLDATNAPATGAHVVPVYTLNTTAAGASGEVRTYPSIGYHYSTWVEKASGANCTFYGDDGSIRSGLWAEIDG